jgi:tetratricopeptide (TPR) repeat protein
VFRYSTVKGWVRREAILLGCLGAAGALLSLAAGLGLGWAGIAAAGVAVAGAIVRFAIAVLRARLEGRREYADLDRRTRVPVSGIASVVQTDVGVDAAAPQSVLRGTDVPRYVPRDADAELREAAVAALDGSGRWIVVAEGPSKVGKSRTLFEALRHAAHHRELDFVAPKDAAALRELLNPDEPPPIRREASVLWLDDLEPFLNDGLTLQTLQEWHAAHPRTVVAATYGGKGSDRVGEAASAELATIAAEVLQHAREIGVAATTAKELRTLLRKVSRVTRESIERHGLAAYLVAGPELERKLATRRHAPGEEESPAGIAVVRASVDWARCGRTDPLAEGLLRELWQHYLPRGTGVSAADFDAGVEWALRAVAGTIALVEHDGGYRAYDYVTRLIASSGDSEPPPDAVWASAVSTSGAQALAVGERAFEAGRFEYAREAFERAGEDEDEGVAAIATVNLGATLGELGRIDEELEVYERLDAQLRDATHPTLLEALARALFNKGVAFDEVNRIRDEFDAYRDLDARFGDSEHTAVLVQVARGLVNQAIRLRDGGRYEEAIRVDDEVVARFGGLRSADLHAQVLKALANKATALQDSGRSDAALEVYDDLVDRIDGELDAASRDVACRALRNKALLLRDEGRYDEELAALDEVVDRFGEYHDMPGQLMRALLGRGQAFQRFGQTERAVADYEEAIHRFQDTEDAEVEEGVALAGLSRADALSALGRPAEAIAAYEWLMARFDGSSPGQVSELMAWAWVNRGRAMDDAGWHEEAVSAFDQALTRFDEEDGELVEGAMTRARLGRGLALAKLGRSEDAAATLRAVVGRLDGATDEESLKAVGEALIAIGGCLVEQKRFGAAVAAYEEVDTRLGKVEAPALQRHVAAALFNKAAALEADDRLEEAAAAYLAMADRFAHSDDEVTLRTVWKAVLNKEGALARLRGARG